MVRGAASPAGRSRWSDAVRDWHNCCEIRWSGF